MLFGTLVLVETKNNGKLSDSGKFRQPLRKQRKKVKLLLSQYCEQTSKLNANGVNWNGLFKTMIGCKGFPGFFYIKWKEGEREQDSRETERESTCKRQSIAARER